MGTIMLLGWGLMGETIPFVISRRVGVDKNRAPAVNDFARQSTLRCNSPIISVRVIVDWSGSPFHHGEIVQQLTGMKKAYIIVQKRVHRTQYPSIVSAGRKGLFQFCSHRIYFISPR